MAETARKHGAFDVKSIDLAEVDLPIFDEASYPMLRQYESAHTLRWSETIANLDAVVFVTPEYNHAPPPSVINALTYLCREWAYMPVGFVGYGGIPAAARAIQVLRQSASALRMVAIPESVLFPNAMQLVDGRGALTVSPESEQAAGQMLDELKRWAEALASLRLAVREKEVATN
jgi:NAD(P)H-dependent FMN reductase